MNRCEHPKPQFVREDWVNLNGKWNFSFDFGLSGLDKEWNINTDEMKGEINVPFCPESELSGVGYKDFINGIWYTRDLPVPDSWKGDRVFLHFGAADYETSVFVNGVLAGKHYGGGVSFSFDITDFLNDADNKLVVFVKDTPRYGQQRGKQCDKFKRYGCLYTRTTGIWQTVWLERRPNAYIEKVKIQSDFDGSKFIFTPVFRNNAIGDKFRVSVKKNDTMLTSEYSAQSGIPVFFEVKDFIPWSPENPYLYDIEFELVSENGTDKVKSYGAMRKISVEKGKFYLNNEEIFLRFVLDQGFYPKGIWTAPSDEDLKNDIVLSQNAGFNGARLHQKVFEERFLYHADTLGYLVWAENYDWGLSWDDYYNMQNFENEWAEEIERDVSHPCIIGWTLFNETSYCNEVPGNRDKHDKFVKHIYDLTHAMDPTRPVNDTSGYVHVKTDIYTIHDYEQDAKKLAERYADMEEGMIFEADASIPKVKWTGQPFIIDEYGGPFWAPENKDNDAWGYSGNNDIEEVYGKIEKLTAALTDNPKMAGFCYTQLTDVEQEKNGVYTYERKLKFDMKRIKSYFSRP
ncbi:MAG: beta-glucuronidase, partial [Armatimonadetes bacterium]|nr:beta-glucuronidase [Candidatus Hippobium faecium]